MDASKKKIIKTIQTGIKPPRIHPPPNPNIIPPNFAKICNKVWPDIIFANNLIAKLNNRAKYEIISIIIKNGTITIGVFAGKNKEKNSTPCLFKLK